MPIPVLVDTIAAAPSISERRIYEYKMDTSLYLDSIAPEETGYARRVAAGRLTYIRNNFFGSMD